MYNRARSEIYYLYKMGSIKFFTFTLTRITFPVESLTYTSLSCVHVGCFMTVVLINWSQTPSVPKDLAFNLASVRIGLYATCY